MLVQSPGARPTAMTLRLLLTLSLALCSAGHLGKAPSQPRVQCHASRYPVAVDCSWTMPPAANATTAPSFVATYRLGVAAHRDSRPCLQPAPGSTHCTIRDFRLFSPAPYVLNVTAVHPGGASSSFLPFVAEYIIRPDPPESVWMSPVAGPRLQVHWQPPSSWPFPDIFSLKYRVRYKRHGATRFRQVGPTEATSLTLKAGRPHNRYCVQVSAQDLTDYGEPSAWSLPAVPSPLARD